MAGIVTSNKIRRLIGNRLKEIDVPTSTLNTSLFYADLSAQGASFTQSRVNAELNAYPVTVKNNASLALTPSANKEGVVYAMNGDSKTLEEFEFQRGSSATYFDASGVMQLAAPNVPRINYENGVAKGLLIEPPSANLVPFSGMGNYGAFQAIYTADIPRCSVVVEANKSCIRINNLSTTFRLAQRTITGNNVYTYSFWIKGSSNFNLRLSNYSGGNPYSTTYHDVTTSWQRVTKTFVSSPDTNYDIIHINIQSGTVAEVYIADIQLEAGSVATSYIPTTDSISTRLADKVLSKRPLSVFNKNSLFVKTAEWAEVWFGNGVDKLIIMGRNYILEKKILSFGSAIIVKKDYNGVIYYMRSELSNVTEENVFPLQTVFSVKYIARGVTGTNPRFNVRYTDGSVDSILSNANGTPFLSPTEKSIFRIDTTHSTSGFIEIESPKAEPLATTAWTPAPEDYVKIDVDGNMEISYDIPIHIQQFSLISRELSQAEV